MPAKSRSHEANLTLAGHPASPSDTGPLDQSPWPAGCLQAVRQSGTEPRVTTKEQNGAGEDSNTNGTKSSTKARTLTFTHIHTGISSSHTPDRDLLFTPSVGGSEPRMRMCVNKTCLSTSQELSVSGYLSSPLSSFFLSVCERKELIHSFLIISFPPCPTHKTTGTNSRTFLWRILGQINK